MAAHNYQQEEVHGTRMCEMITNENEGGQMGLWRQIDGFIPLVVCFEASEIKPHLLWKIAGQSRGPVCVFAVYLFCRWKFICD